MLRTGTQTHLSTQEFRQSPSHAYIINILLYDQSYLIPCTHNIYSVYWPHGTYFAIHLFPISTDLFFYILVYIICFNKDFFFFFTSNQDTRLNYFNEYLICFLFFFINFLTCNFSFFGYILCFFCDGDKQSSESGLAKRHTK